MPTTPSSPSSLLPALLDELLLIRASLLPSESLIFDTASDQVDWSGLLDAHSSGSSAALLTSAEHVPPSFAVSVVHARASLKILPCARYPAVKDFDITARGEIGREDAERWRGIIREAREMMDTDPHFPMYELVSLSLLPILHHHSASPSTSDAPDQPSISPEHDLPYQALFTSHHLIAPSKRRSLLTWSSELHINGFAKLGYPGIIYACGPKADVVEFVAKVKALTWLALRLRLLEPLPEAMADAKPAKVGETGGEPQSWKEFEKVGEVVGAMRELGRESLLFGLGIGAGGA